MTMVDIPTLLTIMFVLVDDWYQEFGHQFVPPMPGPKLSFSDSEMMTTGIAIIWDVMASVLLGGRRFWMSWVGC